MQYVICGDTKDYNECLVYTCGGDKSWAETVLNRMKTEPTELDKRYLKTHANLRVKEVDNSNAWWLYERD